MLTWLRIIVSCFCLVLCVSFAALWPRSYSWYERVTLITPYVEAIIEVSFYNGPPKGTAAFRVYFLPDGSMGGFAELSRRPVTPVRNRVTPVTFGNRVPVIVRIRGDGILGFKAKAYHSVIGPRILTLQAPHWFLIALTAILAYIAKPKPRWQFGMRELFVLSTIGAITVGALAIMLRAIST